MSYLRLVLQRLGHGLQCGRNYANAPPYNHVGEFIYALKSVVWRCEFVFPSAPRNIPQLITGLTD